MMRLQQIQTQHTQAARLTIDGLHYAIAEARTAKQAREYRQELTARRHACELCQPNPKN